MITFPSDAEKAAQKEKARQELAEGQREDCA